MNNKIFLALIIIFLFICSTIGGASVINISDSANHYEAINEKSTSRRDNLQIFVKCIKHKVPDWMRINGWYINPSQINTNLEITNIQTEETITLTQEDCTFDESMESQIYWLHVDAGEYFIKCNIELNNKRFSIKENDLEDSFSFNGCYYYVDFLFKAILKDDYASRELVLNLLFEKFPILKNLF